jgi:hypothetical protein
MPRSIQGALLCAGILTAIIGLLTAADAGSAPHCAPVFPKWFGCILATHEGLAGGLIGSGGAIFAGWLAWTGVRDQVQAERDLSTARERENQKAILIEMKDLFDTLNEIWRAIDLALIAEQTAEQRRHRIALAKSVMMTLPADRQLRELKDFTDALAKDIAPGKRGQFIRVWQSIDWIYREKNEDGVVPENDDGRYRLRMIRIDLSHFERYLVSFDREAASGFESRTMENVDHRGLAAQIRPLIDEAEQGKGGMTRAIPQPLNKSAQEGTGD